MLDQDLIAIGQQLARFRKDKKLTQAALGALASIDRQTVSEIENGKFTGSLAILLRYLRYAGLTLSATPAPSPFPEFDSLKERYADDDG